ncbi:hypothetical protein CQW23_16855 [Capsicum baccatum]|uniref:Protein kinase domain-containing protein n=1 Tax=Capsicum baccatum TaxID=33114 RepID=A0A2G2WCJ4_CAPBA|nr:hypothetical protein CQW23_16855 [Capsicum baccatum]
MTIDSQRHDAGTTMAATTITKMSRTNAPQTMSPMEKSENFMGIDFKRWKQKIFLYLTTRCLQRFTIKEASEVSEGTPAKEHFMIVEAWKHSDFLYRNYILSGLQDDLYNVYSRIKTEKELWGALERKYKTKDAGTNKFFIERFLEYKMKGKKKNQENLAESKKETDDLCAMLSKCNLVGNPCEWWMDSGATCYVCANKEFFSTFDPAQVEEKIYMENSATAKVEGTGKVSTIGKLSYMNLIDIWGYCAEVKNRLLGYDYIEHGSLANNLHRDSVLDREKRFETAPGTTRGLACLHEECLEWALNCDIKPQNIVLDSNYKTKVVDFGLSKLLNRGGVDNSSFSLIRGTSSYMDHERIFHHPITSNVDVYRYGIIILELITGKIPN